MTDVATLKSSMPGRWPEALAALAGINPEIADGRHHPCPWCGGTDRFRVFGDFNETGGCNCSQCHKERNGDGIAAVMKATGCGFSEAVEMIAKHCGINGYAGPVEKVDIVADIARRKRVPLESWKAFGAHEAKRGKMTVCRVPMFDEKGEQCSEIDFATLDEQWLKGMTAKGKPAGLFLAGGNLPQPGDTILMMEGCKDAAASHGLGFQAVGLPTSEMAAKYARLFRGCHIIIIPDRDTAGETGAQKTAGRLAGIAASVRIATLPAELKSKDGDDVRDILAKRDGEQLLRQAIADAVEWQPEPEPTGERISNGREIVKDEEETILVPIPMADIITKLNAETGGWPRRVGQALFVHEGDVVSWLERTPALAGYIGTKTGQPPKFYRSPGFHSLPEVHEELKRTAEAYSAIETLPHHPRIEGIYYACEWPTPGDGNNLRELAGRFCGETDIDGDLILSLFVTPGWGGSGDRPSYGITSDAGRGSGKSTLAKMVGRVWGGRVEISPDESVEVVKQRLLSPDGLTKRVAVIDNLKSMKFSSAGLEALVTADIISGKRMYVGEAARPNNLVWVTTLNGVSFATDWAQRSIIIKLRRPDYSGNWKDETEAFIDGNREAIIADVMGYLQAPPEYTFDEFSRWANWERDVLSRLPDPAEAQKVILERQGDADAEGQESSDFEEHVREQLQEAGIPPSTSAVFLPSAIVAKWLGEVIGEPKLGTTKSTRILNQRITEGGMKRIQKLDRKDLGRGFMWYGEHTNGDTQPRTDLRQKAEGRSY